MILVEAIEAGAKLLLCAPLALQDLFLCQQSLETEQYNV